MQTPPFMSAGLSARKHTQALHIIDLPREGQWSDYKQSGHIGTSVSYFKAALTHWLPLFTLYKTLSTLSVRLAPSTAWTRHNNRTETLTAPWALSDSTTHQTTTLSIQRMLLLHSSFYIDVHFTDKVHALLMLLFTAPRTVRLIRNNNSKNIDKTHTFFQ